MSYLLEHRHRHRRLLYQTSGLGPLAPLYIADLVILMAQTPEFDPLACSQPAGCRVLRLRELVQSGDEPTRDYADCGKFFGELSLSHSMPMFASNTAK
jgi:hypothetical protein